MARRTLIFPTGFTRQLASEEGVYYAPRELTAMARRGEIPSVMTADGKVLLVDDAKAREVLRARKR